MIKWGLQKGLVSLPKSVQQARLYENADVFSWRLTDEDMRQLDGLDEYLVTGRVVGERKLPRIDAAVAQLLADGWTA